MASLTANPTPGTRRRPNRWRRREVLVGYLFALPFLALFVVFTVGPVLASFLMSFTDLRTSDVRSPLAVEVVGLTNYADAFSDETFRDDLIAGVGEEFHRRSGGEGLAA